MQTQTATASREPSGPILLTLQQVAEMLALSKKSISRYWKRGEFPAPIRIGGTLRWRLKDIDDWLDQRDSDS